MLKKLYIEPTTKCNLNCKMCFRNTWFDESIGELSLAEVKHVLATMPSSVETVFFGGQGEPLFHPDIVEMVALSAATGAQVQLLTNGTLLDEQMIRALIDAGLSQLWVSIDDLDVSAAAASPAHSGHARSKQVLENIRRFNRMRQDQKSTIRLGITFVAMKSNVHQLAKLPVFIAQYRVDEVNLSNIYPTDASSREEMLYNRITYAYAPAQGNDLPKVDMPFFDMNIPEVSTAVSKMLAKQNFILSFNGEPVVRKSNYCKFIREGMCFVSSDGEVCPCMALLHNGRTYMDNVERKIYRCSFGNIKQQDLEAIWNSEAYTTFRRKFDDFDFSPCLYCGHCDSFAENREDCTGNQHPTCGGCLWAEGVFSCP